MYEAARLNERVFLSTPSGWRATFKVSPFARKAKISIHALRVEGDGAFRILFVA